MEKTINWIWEGLKGQLFEWSMIMIVYIISRFFWDNQHILILRFFIVSNAIFMLMAAHYYIQNTKNKKILQMFATDYKTEKELLEDKVLVLIDEEINTNGNIDTDNVDKLTGQKSFSIEIFKSLKDKGLISYRNLSESCCDGDYMLSASSDNFFTLEGLEYLKSLKASRTNN